MSRRVFALLAVLSAAIAVAAGSLAQVQFKRLAVNTDLIVPAMEIPSNTVITREMVRSQPFPANFEYGPVYRTLEELAGKITTTTLEPGQLIYWQQAVESQIFRYTDDERLEVVSFPIRPEQAVGGQLKPGQHITVYRLEAQDERVTTSGVRDSRPGDSRGSRLAVIGNDLLVVEIGSERVGSLRLGSPRPDSGSNPKASEVGSVEPLTVITVAVPPAVAKQIILLAGDSYFAGRSQIWVTLSPLVGSTASR